MSNPVTGGYSTQLVSDGHHIILDAQMKQRPERLGRLSKASYSVAWSVTLGTEHRAGHVRKYNWRVLDSLGRDITLSQGSVMSRSTRTEAF